MHQAWKRGGEYSQAMLVYSGLKGLFMLGAGVSTPSFAWSWLGEGRGASWEGLPDVGPVGEDVLVEVAPGYFGYPAYDVEVPLVELFRAVGVSGASDRCAGG